MVRAGRLREERRLHGLDLLRDTRPGQLADIRAARLRGIRAGRPVSMPQGRDIRAPSRAAVRMRASCTGPSLRTISAAIPIAAGWAGKGAVGVMRSTMAAMAGGGTSAASGIIIRSRWKARRPMSRRTLPTTWSMRPMLRMIRVRLRRCLFLRRDGGRRSVRRIDLAVRRVLPGDVLGCEHVAPGHVRPGDVAPRDVRPADVRPRDVAPGGVRPADRVPGPVALGGVAPADRVEDGGAASGRVGPAPSCRWPW